MRAHYLSNQELVDALLEAKQLDQLTDRLATLLKLLVDKIGNHRWFNGYSYLEDMKARTLLTLVENWRKWDPEKGGNAFAYFSQAIFRDLASARNLEHDHQILRDIVLLNSTHLMADSTNELLTQEQMDSRFQTKRAQEMLRFHRAALPTRRRLEYNNKSKFTPTQPEFIAVNPHLNDLDLTENLLLASLLASTLKIIPSSYRLPDGTLLPFEPIDYPTTKIRRRRAKFTSPV